MDNESAADSYNPCLLYTSYVKESERMMNDISHLVCDTVDYSMSAGIHDWASIKTKIIGARRVFVVT